MNRLRPWVGVLVGFSMSVGVGGGLAWAQDEAGQDASGREALEHEAEAPVVTAALTDGAEAPISVDFKDADIRQVLRIISIKSGVDIVAGQDVEGLVTIKLTDVPWEGALDVILRTYGLTYERKGRMIRVMTMEALEQEALATEVFSLNYANARDIPNIINEMLSDRGRVRFDERTNTVIVTDVPSSLFQIQRVLERVDQRTPQVLIDTRVVETKLQRDENLGFRWSDSLSLSQTESAFNSTFPFLADGTLGEFGEQFIGGEVRLHNPTIPPPLLSKTGAGNIGVGTLTGPQLSVTLNFLKQRTDTKIISNPSLAVLNHQEARIHIGEEFPVPTFSVDPQTGNTTVSGFETKTIGTVLVVTPHVNPAREIVVDLKPEVVSVGSNATFQIGDTSSDTVSLPRFNTQTVQTQVRIASGETVAIGGLVKTEEVIQENKVPLLGDLPILGALFRSRLRVSTSPTIQQDLLIFLTVVLMDEEQEQGRQAVASTVTAEP